ncbi:MAG: DUF366 family protein [Oligoflexia bacterium]|nr:DUF366 family protein [Oligoflexia bacterium]
MKFKFLDNKLAYDGTQLVSLYAYLNHGVLGDSMIAFEGPCSVSFDHMVDGEDLLAKSEIRGSHMLHFIVEEFGRNLEFAVTRQRLLACIVKEEIERLRSDLKIQRDGDDLFWLDGKASISIATSSPVSCLIHFAINISNEGTPVKTSCLQDLQIKPAALAMAIGERWSKEVATIKEATCKVRWVK